MKKTVKSLFAVAAITVAFASCEKQPTPDGAVALQSFVIEKALNSSVAADITGKVNDAASAVYVALPEGTTMNTYVVTFTTTENDVVYVGGSALTSGVSSVKIANGTVLKVVDEVSKLEKSYTIKALEDDGKAELLSLAIAAADNASMMTADVVAEVAPEMIVRVPGTAFRQSLTLALAAGKNDQIKVNNALVADKVTVDTSFPVDINVTDTVANVSAKYILKVGKILGNNWTLVGEYSNADLADYVALAVDRAADQAYLALQENNTVDGVTTKNLATVLKYDGSKLAVLGSAKFTGSSSTYASIDVMDGKPYVAFVDAAAPTKNRVSCMSYDGASWGYVGDAGFGAKITGISYYKFDMILNPADKNPIVALTTNEALNGQAKRDLSVSIYNGSAWDANKPVSGRTQTYCYNEKLARSNDAVYLLAANQNDKTFSLYQYKDKSWSVLQSDLVIKGTSDICTYFADLDCAADGTVIAAVGDNSSGNYLCTFYKWNGKELVTAQNPLPGVTFDDTRCQWDLTFDRNNNPVVACIASEEVRKVRVFTINPETKTWDDPAVLDVVPNGCYLAADRADNGSLYVAVTTKSGDYNCVKLFKGTLEEDILPE